MQEITETETQTSITVERFCQIEEHDVRLVITTHAGNEVRISVNNDGSILVHHAKNISIATTTAPHDVQVDESFIRVKNLSYLS